MSQKGGGSFFREKTKIYELLLLMTFLKRHERKKSNNSMTLKRCYERVEVCFLPEKNRDFTNFSLLIMFCKHHEKSKHLKCHKRADALFGWKTQIFTNFSLFMTFCKRHEKSKQVGI